MLYFFLLFLFFCFFITLSFSFRKIFSKLIIRFLLYNSIYDFAFFNFTPPRSPSVFVSQELRSSFFYVHPFQFTSSSFFYTPLFIGLHFFSPTFRVYYFENLKHLDFFIKKNTPLVHLKFFVFSEFSLTYYSF